MVFVDQSLHIHGSPTHLLPVDRSNQCLLAHIFSAHAPSIRGFPNFSRDDCGGFFTASLFEGWVGFDFNSPGYRHLSKLPSNEKNLPLAAVAGYAKRIKLRARVGGAHEKARPGGIRL
jgi:hypothetical protein